MGGWVEKLGGKDGWERRVGKSGAKVGRGGGGGGDSRHMAGSGGGRLGRADG